MSDDTKWTKEPWRVERDTSDNDGGTRTYIAGGGANDADLHVARLTGVIEGSAKRWADEDMAEETRARNEADALRIVSCVNLLSAHPDLARVTVVGEEAVSIIKELVEVYNDTGWANPVWVESKIRALAALLPSATVKE